MLTLPKDKKKLGQALRGALDHGKLIRSPLSIMWQVNYWYLQGVRNFRVVSWQTGTVRGTWESPEGQLRYTHDDLTRRFQRELGLVMRADVAPKIGHKEISLDGMRRAAMGQVGLDLIVDNLDLERTKTYLAEMAMMFGTAGLSSWAEAQKGVNGRRARLEVVPPWQIVPLPSAPTMASEVMGIMRHRWVPVNWLKRAAPGWTWPSMKDPHLNLRYLRPGEKMSSTDDASLQNVTGVGSPADWTGTGVHDEGDPHSEAYVELVESFLPDAEDRLDRKISMVGQCVVEDLDFSAKEPTARHMMPLNIVRCNHKGGFWGGGWLDPLVPLNSEIERMLTNLFKNVQELDQFGALFVPANMGLRRQHFESKQRPRVFFYEPDFTSPKLKPESLSPTNTGDFPGKVAASATGLLDKMSGESDMFSGDVPGRLESAVGLGLLYETSSIPRVPFHGSFARGFIGAYKCFLGYGDQLLGDTSNMKIRVIDDNIVGVVVEPDGSMKLDPAAGRLMPQPHEVIVGIKQATPKLVSERKQELLLMLEKQIVDPSEFRWISYKEGLGFPIGNWEEIEQRRTAMLRNIVQWGDGQTPGGVTISMFDMHELQIRCVRAFMARPSFALASDAVRSGFESRLQQHETALGIRFPDQLPLPEDLGGSMPWGAAGLPPGQLPPGLESAMSQADNGSMGPLGGPQG